MTSDVALTLMIASEAMDGSVHLDTADMRLLGVMAGDLVAAVGAAQLYLRVQPAFLGDHNQRLARVSISTALNLGVFEGQKVRFLSDRVSLPLAERVVLDARDDVDRLHLIARQGHLADCCLKRAVCAGEEVLIPTLDRFPLRAKIVEVFPSGAAQVGSVTAFSVAPAATAASGGSELLPIAGLRESYRMCQKILSPSAPLMGRPWGGTARSILLSGRAGCGKARLVARLAQERGAFLQTIDVPQLLARTEKGEAFGFEDILADLHRRGNAVLLLDRLEVLCEEPSRASRAVVAQLGALFDDLSLHPALFVFGVFEGVVPAQERLLSRFDVSWVVDVPDRWGRREILHLATGAMALEDDVDLDVLAAHTSGLTARELCAMVRAAFGLSLGARVGMKDFVAAQRTVSASTSGILCDVPDASWDDVVGLDDVKRVLLETLEWATQGGAAFRSAGVSPPRSVLLSGGQGTGKSSLARALATHRSLNLVEVSCPAMVAGHKEEGARFLQESFALARRKAPALLFFDDLDVLFEPGEGGVVVEKAPHRHPYVARLLLELDALPPLSGVMVMAATNRPDRLTAEVLRSGRFDFAMTLPMPDVAARRRIFQIHTRKMPLSSEIDLDRLAADTQGFSPADIAVLCNRVGLLAVRRALSLGEGGAPPVVTPDQFEQALRAFSR